MSNIAVYAGSFDPFTNGHLDIVRRAAKFFDEVIILLAVNPFKSRTFDMALMADKIYDILQGDEFQNCRVYVAGPEMFTIDIAEHFGAKYLIRGVRNVEDFIAEEELATANKRLNTNIETIYFRSDRAEISSTNVKEYIKSQPELVKLLVPEPIYDLIMEQEGKK